jgi:formylglycine-generating enzyme required for sulfatase activity
MGLLALLFGCTELQPAAVESPVRVDPGSSQGQVSRQGPGPAPAGRGGPPGGPQGPGDGFAAESLSSSWRADLSVPTEGGAEHACPQGQLPVPAGTFLMGSSSEQAGSDESPVHPVYISAFCLDKLEASTAQVRETLGLDWVPKGSDARGFEGGVEPGRGSHPAEGLTWEEAAQYCQAREMHLPTEAEWEKAARGGCELGSDPERCDSQDLRAYPWGSAAPNCTRANHATLGMGAPELCLSDSTPVEQGGAGPYGHLNLSGNVWEWVADAYHPRVYGVGDRRDPSGPSSGETHVMRGGGWNTFSSNMRVANRCHDWVLGSAVGVRCASSETERQPDPVSPLELVSVSGTLRRDQPFSGRALYISVFDAQDQRGGMLPPGMSPIAELRLQPNGRKSQDFEIQVPRGGEVLVFGALDDGSGAQKEGFHAASGSGGMGQTSSPVRVDGPVSGVEIQVLVRSAQGPGVGPGPGRPLAPGGKQPGPGPAR